MYKYLKKWYANRQRQKAIEIEKQKLRKDIEWHNNQINHLLSLAFPGRTQKVYDVIEQQVANHQKEIVTINNQLNQWQ